jgi:hypothetical protein
MTHFKITEKSEIPLVGCIAFGIIDRGTNLIEVRPTSRCNLKCPFCSVNANNPEVHPHSYEVEKDYLIKWLKKVIKEKESDEIEAHIDAVGEITCHPKIIEILKEIKKIKEVKKISIQANGFGLEKKTIDKMEGVVDRINLSLHSLDKKQAQYLSGIKTYDVEKIKEISKYIAKKDIELLLTPVWIEKINDDQITKIIDFSKKIGAKLGIQKYEQYKYGRRIKGTKATTFWKFYQKLKQLEKEENADLILRRENLGIKKVKRIPTTMDIGDKVNAEIKLPGWIKNQMVAVANDRCITINNCNDKIGTMVRIKITDNKNNIYIAKKV